MLLNPLTFHSPKTIAEAAELYTRLENARLQAGGTFLLNALKLQKRKGAKTPEHIISLSNIEDLRGIEAEKNALIIRSMTTITDLFESKLLEDNFSVLRTVCRNISTNQIRNRATVGGNMTCRYTWTEMPAVMVGLDATLHFVDAAGKRHALGAEEFYKNGAKTSHLFKHVSIPREPDITLAYRRVKKTQYVDIPLLSLLIKTTFQGKNFTNTRVAINNCVQFAQRDAKLEGFLNGRAATAKTAQEALENLTTDIYDTRSNDYKKYMFRVSLKSALEELVKKVNNK